MAIKENESINELTLKIMLIAFVILTIFTISFIHQSSKEVATFENCINQTSCLYELISVTNSTNLCDRAQNSSRCYLSFSLQLISPKLCFNTHDPLACILTLSLENNDNYCNIYRNVSLPSKLNDSDDKAEELITTCNRNVEYYKNLSIEK